MIGSHSIPSGLTYDRVWRYGGPVPWREPWDDADEIISSMLVGLEMSRTGHPIGVSSFRSNLSEISILRRESEWSICWDERFFDHVLLQLLLLREETEHDVRMQLASQLCLYVGETYIVGDPHYAMCLLDEAEIFAAHDGVFDDKISEDLFKTIRCCFRMMRAFTLFHEWAHIAVKQPDVRRREEENLRVVINEAKASARRGNRLGHMMNGFREEEFARRLESTVIDAAAGEDSAEELLADICAMNALIDMEVRIVQSETEDVAIQHFIWAFILIYEALVLLHFVMATTNGAREFLKPKSIRRGHKMEQFRSVGTLTARADVRGNLWKLLVAQYFQYDPEILNVFAQTKVGLREHYLGTVFRSWAEFQRRYKRGNVLAKYENALLNAANVAMANNAVSVTSMLSTLQSQSTQNGWIGAGAWFNRLSSAQAEFNGMLSDAMPTTSPPKILDSGNALVNSVSGGFGNAILGGIGSFMPFGWGSDWGGARTAAAAGDIYADTQKNLRSFSVLIDYANPAATTSTPSSPKCSASDPMACILNLVNWEAKKEGVWQDTTNTVPSAAVGGTNGQTTTSNLTFGVQFAGANPLMEMAALGHHSIQAALNLFNDGIYAVAASAGSSAISKPASFSVFGSVLLQVISAVSGAAAGLLFFLGALFFAMGSALAYVVPLLPFVHFFFQSITWIACVAEAILGVPVIALGHLTPEGDGLPGQAAKGAYFMIFSILLRPVMMVFGLICGLLILYVAVGLLNALYSIAVAAGAGAGGVQQGSHLLVSRLMYTVLYVVFVYSVANHAFRLIGLFPNRALEWMGAKGLSGEQMGDAGHIGQYAAAAAGYLGQRAGDQVSQLGQQARSMGQSIGEAGDQKLRSIARRSAKTQGLSGQQAPSGMAGLYNESRETHEAALTKAQAPYEAVRSFAHDNHMSVEELADTINPSHASYNPGIHKQVSNLVGTDAASNPGQLLADYQKFMGK